MSVNIRTKFLLIFSVFIILFGLFSGISLFLIGRLSTSYQIMQLSQEIEVHMLEARRSEKDFFARNDLQYVDKNKEAIKKLLEHVEELFKLETNSEHLEILEKIKKNSTEYQKYFLEVKELLVTKGLDENSGLRGSFREATHQVEEDIKNEDSTLIAALLMARRREKDYLLRGSEEYVTKFNQEIEILGSLVKSTIKENPKVLENITVYQDDFLILVKNDRLIENKKEQFREYIHIISPVIEEYHVETEEYIASQKRMITFTLIGAIVVVFIFSVLIALSFSGYISRKLRILADSALTISEGDMDGESLMVTSQDELGELARSFSEMKESIKEKSALIERIAQKDLTTSITLKSDRDKLGKSLAAMKDSLSSIISQFNVSAEEVLASSVQLSETSISLSEGAMEQASSLEEITASVSQIASQTKLNTENAVTAKDLSKSSMEDSEKGNRNMAELVKAMTDINSSSDQIKKIVKTIDDISFQINLLALNANVEAARAGKYGKGFAVVAEEVRNLSIRSATAVKETTAMVEESIKNIESGNEIVQTASSQLEKIFTSASKVADIVEEIAGAGKEQSIAIEQISHSLSQVETVTQSYSASAEESASASQQLKAMAARLKNLISEFRF